MVSEGQWGVQSILLKVTQAESNEEPSSLALTEAALILPNIGLMTKPNWSLNLPITS